MTLISWLKTQCIVIRYLYPYVNRGTQHKHDTSGIANLGFWALTRFVKLHWHAAEEDMDQEEKRSQVCVYAE
jgi:hypothetical protein